MTRYLALLAVCCWIGVAAADDAAGPTKLTGRVTDVLGKPIGDARIYVMPPSGEREEAKTDRDGRYALDLSEGGALSVVIAVDRIHTYRQVLVKAGTATTLDVEVETDVSGGEVIKIVDRKLPPPAVAPKPTKDIELSLPYSEEAMERAAWGKAWLLLDVDETGKVTRIKLLKRPGFGLDQIAIDEAFKLKFEPARDGAGRPMRTLLVWSMEWPSYDWLLGEQGTASRRPPDADAMLYHARSQAPNLLRGPLALYEPHALNRVPCAGSGPLNLDSRNRTYRDCSRPDLANADALPWITPETAPTALAELSRKPLPMYTRERGSRIPEIVATSATGVLVVATVVSFAKFYQYQSLTQGTQWKFESLEDYTEHKNQMRKWDDLSLSLTAVTLVSGAITAFLWTRHQTPDSFSVQPTTGGAVASFGRSF
jgi:hypothetical protein